MQQAQQQERQIKHVIMDLRKLCQRLNTESLKDKLPALPQLGLPKSLINRRAAGRIFCKLNENVRDKATQASEGATASSKALQLPQASYISRTTKRRSTVSSLVQDRKVNDSGGRLVASPMNLTTGVYSSAGTLNDDFYTSYGIERAALPISPIKMPLPKIIATQKNGGGSLTQKLQRRYKNISELQFKHLFVKQTAIRLDNIEIGRYVEQYESERHVEQLTQSRRDLEIAENYNLKICSCPSTRQNTVKEKKQLEDEHRCSSIEQMIHFNRIEKRMSAMSTFPAAHLEAHKKSSKAATRIAKVRQPSLQMPENEQAVVKQPHEQKHHPVRQAMHQGIKHVRKSIKRVYQYARPTGKCTDTNNVKGGLSQSIQTRARMTGGLAMRARLHRLRSSSKQKRWRKSSKKQDIQQKGAAVAEAIAGAAKNATYDAGMSSNFEPTMCSLKEKIQKFFQRFGNKKPLALQLSDKPNTVGHEPSDIDDDEELAVTYHHSDESKRSDDDEKLAVTYYHNDESERSDDDEELAVTYHHSDERERRDDSAVYALDQLNASENINQNKNACIIDFLDEHVNGFTARGGDSEFTHTLIQQQRTEPTLITAMVTTLTPPPSVLTYRHQLVPNEHIIAGLKEQQQLQNVWPGPALYKPKSIDIFETDGSAAAAFADFDEALRNAPVLYISVASGCKSAKEADDNGLGVTDIRLQATRYGIHYESLVDQQPLENNKHNVGKQATEVDLDLYENKKAELPFLVSTTAPSLPPLPQRRPPICDAVPPPLPVSRKTSPIATTPITVSASVALLASQKSKPLVKTSSLRLTYKEQMLHENVGKVNKLITRFEGRPLISDHRLHSEEPTFYSDEDSVEVVEQETVSPKSENVKHQPILHIIPASETLSNINTNSCKNSAWGHDPSQALTRDLQRVTTTLSTSACTTVWPLQSLSQSQLVQCNQCSMTCDVENVYSFDSDEENSYYSISPSNSNRYVVKI